jgi:hypothetical protein
MAAGMLAAIRQLLPEKPDEIVVAGKAYLTTQ